MYSSGLESQWTNHPIVMENHLSDGRTWFVGDEYTIADMAIYPWCLAFKQNGYNAVDFLGLDTRYPQVQKWMARMAERPAVQRGMLVCGGPGSLIKLQNLARTHASTL